MNPDSVIVKLVMAIAELAVCGVWVWVAVCTTSSLGFLTSHAVPFAKRTMWLTKILALIVGAGGVMGGFSQIGLAWYFAAVPAVTIVFFALREKVDEVVIPTPPRTKASYLPAWESYRRFRRNVVYSYVWLAIGFAVTFTGTILVSRSEKALPEIADKLILAILGMIFLALFVNVYYWAWKFAYWLCPRCGCVFRGFMAPWLPKQCRYCGLPRWEENPERGP